MVDFWGMQESKSEQRRRGSREIIRKGKAAEEIVKDRYELRGYQMERTGKGHDYKATKRDLWGKVVDTKYVEVKSPKSPLSKRQKEAKAEKKSHYKVERVDVPPFFWKEL